MFKLYHQLSTKNQFWIKNRLVGIGSLSLSFYIFQQSSTLSTSCDSDTNGKLKLYQYQICPFCNRVKAYLDYHKIDYDVIEVNPLTKSEISFSKDYKKVPIAISGGKIVGDSNAILESLKADSIGSRKLLVPDDSQHWSEWSEKRLAVMLYPNITRSFNESWECFGYAAHIKSWSYPEQLMVRVAGSAAMYLANGKIKSKYGIVDERKSLKDELELWCAAIRGKRFLHGDTISLPDLMVFGVLKSISGLTTFREIMLANDDLSGWYKNVETEINK
eukprot:gene11024-14805_t